MCTSNILPLKFINVNYDEYYYQWHIDVSVVGADRTIIVKLYDYNGFIMCEECMKCL